MIEFNENVGLRDFEIEIALAKMLEMESRKKMKGFPL